MHKLKEGLGSLCPSQVEGSGVWSLDFNKFLFLLYKLCCEPSSSHLRLYSCIFSFSSNFRVYITDAIVTDAVLEIFKPNSCSFMYLSSDFSRTDSPSFNMLWKVNLTVLCLQIAPTFFHHH